MSPARTRYVSRWNVAPRRPSRGKEGGPAAAPSSLEQRTHTRSSSTARSGSCTAGTAPSSRCASSHRARHLRVRLVAREPAFASRPPAIAQEHPFPPPPLHARAAGSPSQARRPRPDPGTDSTAAVVQWIMANLVARSTRSPPARPASTFRTRTCRGCVRLRDARRLPRAEARVGELHGGRDGALHGDPHRWRRPRPAAAHGLEGAHLRRRQPDAPLGQERGAQPHRGPRLKTHGVRGKKDIMLSGIHMSDPLNERKRTE